MPNRRDRNAAEKLASSSRCHRHSGALVFRCWRARKSQLDSRANRASGQQFTRPHSTRERVQQARAELGSVWCGPVGSPGWGYAAGSAWSRAQAKRANAFPQISIPGNVHWTVNAGDGGSRIATESTLASNNLTVNGAFLGTVLYQPATGLPTTFGTNCASAACFTTSSFATPTNFDANARNAFRGPGYFNTDLNIKKTFAATERLKFTLGANFFNVLNHPNFQNPVNNDLSSSFGQITALAVSPTTPYGAFASAAEGMRILQVFGKVTF